MFDADRFRRRNLHMIDVGAVPKRLDHAIGEAEDHQVLNGFLAEIVVDAENLFFSENFFQLFVQLLCRRQIVAERLFHDDPRPLAIFFLGEADFAELLHDQREKS